MSQLSVTAFFDETTFTVTYVAADPGSAQAAIIDPVLDFDPASGRTSTASADKVVDFVRTNDLSVGWILETHVHADHLTAAPYLKEKLGGRIAIGKNVAAVQDTFKSVFNIEDLATDGTQFDACITYVVGDAAFVGDTLFMPDFGTARTDFPGGDAGDLYDSIQKILALPEDTRLFMCHDYKAPGRDDFRWETSVAEQRDTNIHINRKVSRDEFVAMRESRDAELGMPKLILPSIQVNVRAGYLPNPESNGVRYLKIPLDSL
jgi:glyoxylase-like metal-dependent hydrolase (beta-lactamase superfamily II)